MEIIKRPGYKFRPFLCFFRGSVNYSIIVTVRILFAGLLLIYSLLYPSELYCETNLNLSLLWRYFPVGNVYDQPACDSEGNIYFTSRGKRLYALSKNGKELWSYENRSEFVTPIVVGFDSSIVVGDKGKNIICFYPNGEIKWKLTFSRGRARRIALGFNGDFYVVTDAVLYAISYFGRLKWGYRFGSRITAGPVVTYSGDIALCTNRGVYLIDKNGEAKWKFDTDFSPNVCIGALNGDIIIGGMDKLVALDIRGRMSWRYIVNGKIIGLLESEDRNVFGVTSNGYLYIVDSRGKLIGSYELGIGIKVLDALIRIESGICKYLLLMHSDRTVIFLSLGLANNRGIDNVVKLKIYKFIMAKGINGLFFNKNLYISLNDWSLGKFVFPFKPFLKIGNINRGWIRYLHDGFHSSMVGFEKHYSSGVYLGMIASVKSDNYELAIRALNEIRSYLDGRKFLPLYADQMEKICRYSLSKSSLSGAGKPLASLKYAAIDVLRRLKTRSAEVILERFVRNERDPDVIVACIRALGDIGFDPYNDVFEAMVNISKRYADNDRIMVEVVRSLGKMVRINGVRKSKNVLSLLIKISYGEYNSRVVKNLANAILNKILSGKI